MKKEKPAKTMKSAKPERAEKSDKSPGKIKFDSKEEKQFFWHSTAHILADAVLKVRPKAKLGFGPPIDEGFYYDFDTETFSPEDIAKIEKEMQKIIQEKIPFKSANMSRKDAEKFYKDQPYKLELLKDVPGEKIHFNQHGTFSDLCKYTMIDNTGQIGAVKILNTASAYWRGDSNNKQLQRIYAISFPTKQQLDEFVKLREEAEKRDHRKVGKELNLIYFHEFAPGAPFYLKNGTVIYNLLTDFIRAEYRKRGYEEVITPQLYNKKLWETSGHWEHYKENMFIVNVEGQEHSLKPMNCPSHCLIYNRDMKSYKDLPVRIADFCNLHRNELSGTLSGLFRVRKFAQDDGHIFCTLDQVEKEVLDVLDFIKYVWNDVFNFKVKYYLSTRPEKAMGSKATWDKAEALLAGALKKSGISYEIKKGDGAFYGPKIDIEVEDSLGRTWQCPTCQLDFNLPERFDLKYEGSDGKKHQPVMIHRAVLGSLERFMGVMIEHYAGAFPTWLSPVQVKVLTFTDRNIDYSNKITEKLKGQGIRAEIDSSQETVQNKVRRAQLEKVPFILVCGDKEEQAGTLAVRTRDGKVKFGVKTDDFIAEISKLVAEKK